VALTYCIAAYIILPRRHSHGPEGSAAQACGPASPLRVTDCPVIRSTLPSSAPSRSFGRRLRRWDGWKRIGSVFASSWGMVPGLRRQPRPIQPPPFSTLLSVRGVARTSVFRKPSITARAKRHHIRFWALGPCALPKDTWGSRRLLAEHRSATGAMRAAAIWVGAGTRDTGLSLTKLSFQITHATDFRCECGGGPFIVAGLMKSQLIADVTAVQSGQRLPAETRQPLLD